MDDEEYEIKKPSEFAKLNEYGCYEEPDGGVFIDDIYIGPPPPPALTFENDRPRLIITHIECYNFKSYAGKQVLGPFHKSFTSIVGPNGSGKSNVIDSMLFVFGYRAQKIRSKKISVLIHSSPMYTDLQSCTVKVFFQEIIDQGDNSQNSEGYEVVPNSQIVVSRTAMKDSSSYYEVNGKRKKFGDVASLLREKGIDLDHNRFLILQGEVEQIALMKPKAQSDNEAGMLEFLESIIGSHRFKEAIEKLKEVHNQLDETRNEKLNRVKLVEKEKEALEKPKEEALHLVRQLNSITKLKNQLFQLRVYLSDKVALETQAKKEEFEKSCSELMEKLKVISDEKASSETTIKEISEKLEKMTKEFEADKDLLKSYSLRHDKISDELKILNAKRKKAKQNKEQEETRFEKLEKVPEDNRLKIEELTEHRTKLEAQHEDEKKKKDKALEELQAETQEFQDKKEQLETQLMALQKNENEKQALYDVAKSELDLLKSTEQKEQVKLEQLQQKYNSAVNELSEKEPKLAEHSEKIPVLRSQTEKSKSELSKLIPEYETLSKKVQDMRIKVDETRSKQSAEKHGNRVLEALMRQKAIGNLPGIIGRLGNLGGINKKYDVAISTAAGSGLDRILVDTIETATACVKYLKDNDIGRADLLALESTVKFASNVNCNFKAPGNAPRLIDLVEVNDPKLKTAFYQYLRDTLVADNLKQANEIAYGARRFRVVTLEGETIEISGAMTGGGGPKQRGKMGTQVVSQVNEAEFKKMESSLSDAEQSLRTISERKAEEEQKSAMCSREISDRSRSFEKLKLEVARLKNETALLKEQIEAQKKVVKESKPDLTKVKSLEKKVDALLKNFEEATESSKDIRDGVKEMNKKIQHIQNSKVKAISNKLNEVSTKLDKVKGEITRLQVGIRNSDRDLAKSKDNLETLTLEIKGLEKEMTDANVTREKIKNDAQELTEKCEKSGKEMTEMKNRLKGTRESLKKIEDKENSYKSEKIEFDQQLSNFKNEMSKSKLAAKHWRRERANLKFEDVPGMAPEELELTDLDEEELQNLDDGELQIEIDRLVEETKDKQLNMVVIEQYREKENLYMDRVAEFEEATTLRNLKKKLLEDIKKKRQDEFTEGFMKITLKLKEMYQTITDGGDAELEFVDTLDPFAEGIVFSVRPPKKSWKNISNLSGGEKTLSSLALVFALHYYKPTPLYVMDEIDAALDFKNVSIVSHYIKERTKNAQFIIISLRANMFELADRLVGIYKTNNATKSVTINPNDIIEAN